MTLGWAKHDDRAYPHGQKSREQERLEQERDRIAIERNNLERALDEALDMIAGGAHGEAKQRRIR